MPHCPKKSNDFQRINRIDEFIAGVKSTIAIDFHAESESDSFEEYFSITCFSLAQLFNDSSVYHLAVAATQPIISRHRNVCDFGLHNYTALQCAHRSDKGQGHLRLRGALGNYSVGESKLGVWLSLSLMSSMI